MKGRLDINIDWILEENEKRNGHINQPYDPIVGIGSYGDRRLLTLSDAPYPELYLPVDMFDHPLISEFSKHKSIKDSYRSNSLYFDESELQKAWIDICELRIEYDPEYYFAAYETIEDGLTSELIPFVLNRAQRKFNQIILDDLLNDKPVRIVNTKARQHGISTYVQMLFSWIQKCKKIRWNSVIVAHLNDASKNIRSMYQRSMDYMMPINGVKYEMTAFEGTQSIREIKERGCRITVGSAETPDSVRSQNPKLSHFSEVAMYPDTPQKKTSSLLASILGTMKLVPWTIVVLESTPKGIGDYFHTEYEKAKDGKSAYKAVFLPWFYNPNYSEPILTDYYTFSGKKTSGNLLKFIKSLNDYELNLFNTNKECTLEKINWYRAKNAEMPSRSMMMQEFPSDDIEAFQDSGQPVFRSEDVEALRQDCRAPSAVGILEGSASPHVANVEPGKRKHILESIRFVKDTEATEAWGSTDAKLKDLKTQNRLAIWRMPSQLNIKNRYVVVFDPQRGITDNADWGVIAVFDRMPMMSGEPPEIVAQFRGHIDKDISIWIAAQIAKWYNNALLVVESNTYDSVTRDDDAELIFEVLKRHYSNLYTRTPADKIMEGQPVKWGFNTNRATKPLIISHFVSLLRERGYVERDEEALNEARYFEQKQNGTTGAKEGKHDDILMTRMIGSYVCYQLPVPEMIKDKQPKRKHQRRYGMSDI